MTALDARGGGTSPLAAEDHPRTQRSRLASASSSDSYSDDSFDGAGDDAAGVAAHPRGGHSLGSARPGAGSRLTAATHAPGRSQWALHVSFMQVYREHVYDLLRSDRESEAGAGHPTGRSGTSRMVTGVAGPAAAAVEQEADLLRLGVSLPPALPVRDVPAAPAYAVAVTSREDTPRRRGTSHLGSGAGGTRLIRRRSPVRSASPPVHAGRSAMMRGIGAASRADFASGALSARPSTSSVAAAAPATRAGAMTSTVQGLTHHSVASLAQLQTLVARGLRRRVLRGTLANDASSRSHIVLQLHTAITRRATAEEGVGSPATGDLVTCRSKVTLVDLAGSERCEFASMLPATTLCRFLVPVPASPPASCVPSQGLWRLTIR